MATEFNTGSDASLNEAVKSRYEANSDTNAFTDTEKAKLAAVADAATANPNALDNVVEDTSPQLGGDLDVDGNSIVSTSNGDITIAPNGTGDVVLGNYTLDADATVGAGQDNHVLTYDHSTGKWGPEASAGGGGTVDHVSNVATSRILGRVTASSGNSEELTVSQVRTLLDIVAGEASNTAEFIQFNSSGALDTARPTADTGKAVRWYNTGGYTRPDNAEDVDLWSSSELMIVELTNETDDAATGTAIRTTSFPFNITIVQVDLKTTVEDPTGAALIADVTVDDGTVDSIFSTKPQIDAGDNNSSQSATAAVISDGDVDAFETIAFDVDQVGSTAAGKGLKMMVQYVRR
jgi:hypothetical protein